MFILTNGEIRMKKILTAVALMAMTTTANATDIGMGIDRETKYNSSNEGTTKTYNYAFISHKWEQLGDIRTKATHSQDASSSTTNFNELKIDRDFKFNVADSKTSFKIVPSFSRRWDGQESGIDKTRDNLKVEIKYTF